MSRPSRLENLSTRYIQQVLNRNGSLDHAAEELRVHSSTLSKTINARKISWKPSEKSKAMLKAARANQHAKNYTSFKFVFPNGDSATVPKTSRLSAYGNRIGRPPKASSYASANGSSNGTAPRKKTTLATIPEATVRSVLRELILEGRIKVTI